MMDLEEIIRKALMEYRLIFQAYEDDESLQLELKDALTPKGDNTDERGIQEIEYLAGFIADALKD